MAKTKMGSSRILRVIEDRFMKGEPPPTAAELAEMGGADGSSISANLTRLVKKGFLVRIDRGVYEPGPELFKSIKRRNLRHALEDREMLKRIVDDIEI